MPLKKTNLLKEKENQKQNGKLSHSYIALSQR